MYIMWCKSVTLSYQELIHVCLTPFYTLLTRSLPHSPSDRWRGSLKDVGDDVPHARLETSESELPLDIGVQVGIEGQSSLWCGLQEIAGELDTDHSSPSDRDGVRRVVSHSELSF